MIKRPDIRNEDIDRAFVEVKTKLLARLDEKGPGVYASSHEAWGIIDEEIVEFKQAVKNNRSREQREELIDIAVAAIAALASQSQWDW